MKIQHRLNPNTDYFINELIFEIGQAEDARKEHEDREFYVKLLKAFAGIR